MSFVLNSEVERLKMCFSGVCLAYVWLSYEARHDVYEIVDILLSGWRCMSVRQIAVQTSPEMSILNVEHILCDLQEDGIICRRAQVDDIDDVEYKRRKHEDDVEEKLQHNIVQYVWFIDPLQTLQTIVTVVRLLNHTARTQKSQGSPPSLQIAECLTSTDRDTVDRVLAQLAEVQLELPVTMHSLTDALAQFARAEYPIPEFLPVIVDGSTQTRTPNTQSMRHRKHNVAKVADTSLDIVSKID